MSMKKSLLSTLIIASLGTTAASFASDLAISGFTPEQKNAIDASFDKSAIINHAIRANNDYVRVIIELEDAPLANFEAVAVSSRGEKINFESSAAKEYETFLQAQQRAAIASIKAIDGTFYSDFSYKAAFNGFAGAIHKDKINALTSLPGIKAVYPDAMRYAQMDASLNLVKAVETWETLGGRESAGQGVRVAIIDSGIRPENPLFSGENFEAPDPTTLPDDDYCSEVADFCNNKLIVARHAELPAGFPVFPDENDSPLGFNGHGTHVAGTAVGNYGVTAERDGATAEISGVAPAASLMVYKGLYATTSNPFSSSGSDSMLLSMLEASMLDGADVVNNSWGGGPGSSVSPVYETVFEAMNNAGIVTVFAAGNDGPGPSTIGCGGCSDEVLTVAATTADRLFANEVAVEGGDSMPGLLSGVVELAEPLTGPVVYAGELNAENFEGCSAFADGAFADSIALISRGTCGFADKIANAEAAGATGVLIFNAAGRGEAPFFMGVLSDDQMIPSLMVPHTPGLALAEQAAASDEAVNVTIGNEVVRTTSEALGDILADFSSRGPNGDPSFLKPNIAAPGVNILSGESPDAPGHEGENFSFKNGTSMASPHVAGAAALLKQMHPDWTADQIKSALVASSVRDNVRKDDALTPADHFDIGAGRLDVLRASTAVLTYSDLSLVDGNCFQTCSLTTTVTNTSDAAVSVTGATMFSDSAIEHSLSVTDATLDAGASADITITLNVTSAEANTWQFGGINWTDGNAETTDYYMPVAVYSVTEDNGRVFSADTSASSVANGESFVSSVVSTNDTITGLIEVEGKLDDKFILNPQTLSATKNGDQLPIRYDAETHTIAWDGALNTAELNLAPSTDIADALAGFGITTYFSMGNLSTVSPLNCSSVCDDTSITLTLPQTVNYLGVDYSEVQVSSNGYLVFGSEGTASARDAQVFPSQATPNNVIAAFMTDLDLDGTDADDTGAGVMYAVSLVTGHFVVEWAGVELYGVPGEQYNVQLWLDYETGAVNYVYGPMGAAPTLTEAPGGVSIGAENSIGTIGITQFAVVPGESIGTMPAFGTEWSLTSSVGDQLNINFGGSVADRTAYMADMSYAMEDATVTTDILANDEDDVIVNTFTMKTLVGDIRAFAPVAIDNADLDASSVAVTTMPENGVATVNDDGTITYTPDADFFGEDSYVYSVADVDGNPVGEATVTVMVEGVEDAPVLSVTAPSAVDEQATYTVSAIGSDVDGDTVTVTINGQTGTTYTATAPIAEEGPINMVVTATDGKSTVTQNVTIRVNDTGGGSMGWLTLLLAPIVFMRRRAK